MFTALGDGTALIASNFGTPVVDTWNFLVASYAQGGAMTVQVNNGTANTRTSASTIPVGTSDLFISSRGFGGFFMDGLIDQVGFWKRLLTTQEKTDLYNGGAGLSYAEMVPAVVSGNARKLLLSNGGRN